jgi:hypothetical protein
MKESSIHAFCSKVCCESVICVVIPEADLPQSFALAGKLSCLESMAGARAGGTVDSRPQASQAGKPRLSGLG